MRSLLHPDVPFAAAVIVLALLELAAVLKLPV